MVLPRDSRVPIFGMLSSDLAKKYQCKQYLLYVVGTLDKVLKLCAHVAHRATATILLLFKFSHFNSISSFVSSLLRDCRSRIRYKKARFDCNNSSIHVGQSTRDTPELRCITISKFFARRHAKYVSQTSANRCQQTLYEFADVYRMADVLAARPVALSNVRSN